MMRTPLHTLFLVALLVSSVWAGSVACQTAAPDTAAAAPPDLAILPFADHTRDPEAEAFLAEVLHRALDARGLTYVTAAEVRPLLRAERIRSRGWISRRGAELVGAATGARHLLLGSWDVLKREGNPEVGLSLRVLEMESLALVQAVSVGGTAEDGVGWLDLGRVETLEELADGVVARALDDLMPFPPPPNPLRSWRGCNHLAVVPLDNYSETVYAGDIVTNILLSRLLAAGYFVVEPGFVRELGLEREVIVRGGVDQASARAIDETLGACRVITGEVELFEAARGLPTATIPKLRLGLRVAISETGTLYAMRELEGAGDDTQSVFQRGREHALIPLAERILDDFVQELVKSNREDILHGPSRWNR